MRGQRRVARWISVFFGQTFTESKGKEIKATQELIGRFPELPGCVFTLDALHAVKDTFESVVAREGDFLVCVKDNASNLKKRLSKHLDRRKKKLLRAETVEKGHGRVERRALEMTSVLPWQTQWPHTHTACRVTRERRQIRRGESVSNSFEEVLYVASFPVDRHTPEKVLEFT
ncbi:MAG: ISAs1 family transposase, partial [Kiritimatiellaeota bacterium]|nr:ISAs1 family transposase [Kiritimatiellota bacterium]